MTDAFLFLNGDQMAKITVTYTYSVGDHVEQDNVEKVWTQEGRNAYYDFDEEVRLWWFMCDDKVLIVTENGAQVISIEFEGENEEKPVERKAKKK